MTEQKPQLEENLRQAYSYLETKQKAPKIGVIGWCFGGGWSLATAYSLLAWYVFAPQCISTLAVVKRETNSWRYPILMAVYLFALAYLAAFLTYRITLALGG